MDNAGHDEELLGMASAVVSIQKLRIVWYMEYIAVPPSRLFAEAEFGWKIRKL